MKGIIYKATCNHDGRVYIGQTIAGLKARRNQHEASARRESDKNAFHLALFQYNFDFTWEVIDEFVGSREYVAHALNVAEEFHILKYRSTDERYGFNSTAGGYSSDKFADHLKVSQVVLGGSAPKGYWQYDLDGNFIREFRSLREIAAHFNLTRLNGKQLSEDSQWHGYQWRRKRMCAPWPKIAKYEKPAQRAQKVLQYSLAGDFIAVIESVSEAARVTKDKQAMINLQISGEHPKKKPCYQWRKYEDNFPLNIGPIVLKPRKHTPGVKTKEHRVLQYSKDGSFLSTFDSIKVASEATGDTYGIIRKQCLGGKVRAAKFQWRYYAEGFPVEIGKFRPIMPKPTARPRKSTHTPGQLSMF